MPTPIVLQANDVKIPAILNDTVAARAFYKRLPFTASGYRYSFEYCCRTACGVFDPSETQSGWKNGDIGLASGWFAVFFGGEGISAAYRGMMIIAHIDDRHLPLVKSLPESVRFTVKAAGEQPGPL